MNEVIVQTLRIPKGTRELIKRVCENRSETISNFIRRAILKELAALSYLDEEVKKSLGVKVEEILE